MHVLLLLAAFAAAKPYDVTRYDVALRYQPKVAAIEGTASVEFLTNDSSITLDALALDVREVRCGSTPAEFTTTPETLTIRLPRSARRCTVSYRATPGPGLHVDAEGAYTVFHSSRWMPCNMDIADRATFSLRVDAPREYLLIAAAGAAERPAYLFGFALGKFKSVTLHDGPPVIAVHSATLTPDVLRRAFATTSRMLDFFASYAGLEYPLPRYDQIVIPGAPPQELAGMTLLSTQYVNSVHADASEDYLIAHELAHQWWGNVVVAADPSHYWLQEGIVTFMVAVWKEAYWSRAAYDREIALATARLERAAKQDVPLVHPTAPDLERALVYSRGALVLHTLRGEIGDAAFRDGMKRFVATARAGPVTTTDLETAMEEASGKNLDEFFRRWTREATPPHPPSARSADEGRYPPVMTSSSSMISFIE